VSLSHCVFLSHCLCRSVCASVLWVSSISFIAEMGLARLVSVTLYLTDNTIATHSDIENYNLPNNATDSKESAVFTSRLIVLGLAVDSTILLNHHRDRDRDVTHNAIRSFGRGARDRLPR